MGFKIVSEEAKHFLAEGNDGKTFKIAKSGLSESRLSFFRGGLVPKVKTPKVKVPKLAEGGEVVNEPGEILADNRIPVVSGDPELDAALQRQSETAEPFAPMTASQRQGNTLARMNAEGLPVLKDAARAVYHAAGNLASGQVAMVPGGKEFMAVARTLRGGSYAENLEDVKQEYPSPETPKRLMDAVNAASKRDVREVVAGPEAGDAAAELATNFVTPMAAKVVWHGTPATWAAEPGAPLGQFRRAFKHSGEGGAYKGAGGYVGEAPQTGESYRVGLSKPEVKPLTKAAEPVTEAHLDAFDALRRRVKELRDEYGQMPDKDFVLKEWQRGYKYAAAQARNAADEARWWHEGKPEYREKIEKYGPTTAEDVALYESRARAAEEQARWAASIGPGDIDIAAGRLYELDFPDELLPKVLDFDKPLAQQTPEVREAVATLLKRDPDLISRAFDMAQVQGKTPQHHLDYLVDSWLEHQTGEELYQYLVRQHGGRDSAAAAEAASRALAEAGIPAHQFFDQQSRNASGPRLLFDGEPLSSSTFDKFASADDASKAGLLSGAQSRLNSDSYLPYQALDKINLGWVGSNGAKTLPEVIAHVREIGRAHPEWSATVDEIAQHLSIEPDKRTRNLVVYEPDKHLLTVDRFDSLDAARRAAVAPHQAKLLEMAKEARAKGQTGSADFYEAQANSLSARDDILEKEAKARADAARQRERERGAKKYASGGEVLGTLKDAGKKALTWAGEAASSAVASMPGGSEFIAGARAFADDPTHPETTYRDRLADVQREYDGGTPEDKAAERARWRAAEDSAPTLKDRIAVAMDPANPASRDAMQMAGSIASSIGTGPAWRAGVGEKRARWELANRLDAQGRDILAQNIRKDSFGFGLTPEAVQAFGEQHGIDVSDLVHAGERPVQRGTVGVREIADGQPVRRNVVWEAVQRGEVDPRALSDDGLLALLEWNDPSGAWREIRAGKHESPPSRGEILEAVYQQTGQAPKPEGIAGGGATTPARGGHLRVADGAKKYARGGEVMKDCVVMPNGMKVALSALSPEMRKKVEGKARMADGGMVPYRVKNETESEFEIEDSRGKFRVAKKGLSAQTIGKIKGYADGGEVSFTGDPETDSFLARPEVPTTDLPTPALTGTPEVDSFLARPTPADEAPVVPSSSRAGALQMLQGAPLGPVAGDSREGALAMLQQSNAATPGGDPVAPPAEPFAPAPQAPATQPPAFQMPDFRAFMPPSGGGGGNVSPTLQAISDAEKQQADAYRKKAEVAAREAQDALRVEQEMQGKRDEISKAWQARHKEWEAKRDDLKAQIEKTEIDPNRLWANASTGQKISAAIGLILGGIGSGLTKQPNAALVVIQNAIERDIEAQKVNLGKKETLLAQHMREGLSPEQVEMLTRADMTDAAASQIRMVGLRAVGDKERVNAQSAEAALHAQSALIREQVKTMGVQRDNAALDTQFKRMQMAMMQRQQMIQAAVLGNPGASESARYRALGYPEGLIVEVGPRAFVAKSEKAADTLREGLTPLQKSDAAIDELLKLSTKPYSSVSLQDRATAQTYKQALVGMLRLPFLGPGVIDKRERKILEDIAADPTRIFALDPVNRARLQTLQKILANERNSLLSNYTVGGGTLGPINETRIQ